MVEWRLSISGMTFTLVLSRNRCSIPGEGVTSEWEAHMTVITPALSPSSVWAFANVPNPATFWNNLIHKRYSITEVRRTLERERLLRSIPGTR
jgi:hypothetical protein